MLKEKANWYTSTTILIQLERMSWTVRKNELNIIKATTAGRSSVQGSLTVLG